MSSSRRTAFARTPRGKNSGGATAPTATLINKDFLDRMTQARLAPDMATVLTKANADLSIKVQANGKGNFTIDSLGRTIGDSQDVQKVQALGSFINDERKAIVKTSVSAMAKKTMAAIVQVSRDPAYVEDVPRPITRIDKSFVDIYRTVNAQAEMLNTNLQQIAMVSAVGNVNERFRNHLVESGARIRASLGKYLLYRAGLPEGEEALKLNEYLLRGSVLGWVFTRLCSQKLQLGGKDFEYRKVYFPKDPTKGLQITFSEWKDDNLRENQGGILGAMSVYRGLWSDAAVRTICGIPQDWDLNDRTGPAKVLMNVPIMVVPPSGAVTLEEHFSVLAQNGDRGLPWQVGNTISPQDILKFLGTVPKRIAYGFLGRARFSAPWYETLFPGFAYEPTVTEREGRSVFSQLLSQFRAGTITTTFFSSARGEGDRTAVVAILSPLLLAVMDVPPQTDLGNALGRFLASSRGAIPPGDTSNEVDIWSAFVTRRSMTDEQCANTLQGVLATNLDVRSKDTNKSDVRSARSGLSLQGNTLVREFKRRGYQALAKRVDQWLRSFLTTDLQGPVAEVILARLEASLSTPIAFGRGDAAVFLEPAGFDQDPSEPDNVSDLASEDADNPDDN